MGRALIGIVIGMWILSWILAGLAHGHLDEPIETVIADDKGYWLVGVELDRPAQAVCLSPAGTVDGPYFGCTDLSPNQTIATISGVLQESVESFVAQAVALDAGQRSVSLNSVEVQRLVECVPVDPVCPVEPMCPAGTTTVCVSSPE